MTAPDFMRALERATAEAKAALAAQAERDRIEVAEPKPPRDLPPISDGDVVLSAQTYTLRLCALCDKAIHVGTPIVTHWPSAVSHVSHPFHPSCWESRT